MIKGYDVNFKYVFEVVGFNWCIGFDVIIFDEYIVDLGISIIDYIGFVIFGIGSYVKVKFNFIFNVFGDNWDV